MRFILRRNDINTKGIKAKNRPDKSRRFFKYKNGLVNSVFVMQW